MTVIRFEPGIRPVLKHLPGKHNQKDHGHKGGGVLDLPPYGEDKRDDEGHPEYRQRREAQRREIMLRRLEAIDTPEGRILAEAWRRGMTGKDLPDSVLGEDGIETYTEPPGSRHPGLTSQHVTTAGMERIKAAQGWDVAAAAVDDATFDRLVDTAKEAGTGLGGFRVVYRGGPEGLAADMVSDKPFIGTGMSGPGTYVSESPTRAGWYGKGAGEVVRSLVPDHMVTHVVEDDRYGARGLAALHGHPSSDNGDGWADGALVFNTSAMIVAVPSAPVLKHYPGQHDQKTHGHGGISAADHPAVARLKAGEPVIVQPRDVADVVEAFRGSTDGPVDLTNLHVAGLGLFGGDGLGIPRSDMPQIPKTHRDKFFAELRAKGIDVHDEQVDPTTMKPTQREMDAVNVAGMAHSMRTGNFANNGHTLIASSDGYILDGHHRYAAAAIEKIRTGKGTMGIARVDMPIRQLLDAAQTFNEENGIAARALGDHARRVAKAACDRADALAVLKHLAGKHDQKTHGRKGGPTINQFTDDKGNLIQSIGMRDSDYPGTTIHFTPEPANPMTWEHVLTVWDDTVPDDHHMRGMMGQMKMHPETGEVLWINVDEKYRRTGVATRMWNAAKYLSEQYPNIPAPQHSVNQTDDGRAWAAVVKFAPGLKPVLKHGHHNQKDHGRRYGGTVDPAVASKAIRLVGENGGLSIRLTDGAEPDSGFMVARDSNRFGIAVTADEFYGPNGAKHIAEMVKKNRTELGSGRAYLGVWHQTSKTVDGVEIPLSRSEQVVHLDVTDNIPSKDRAVRLGRRRDQISVWDVANFEEIQTGGSGGEVTKGTDGVRDAEAAGRDVGRGDRRLGGEGPRRDGEDRLGVLKHGDPSRPGYAALHPNSASRAATTNPDTGLRQGWEQMPPDWVDDYYAARADVNGWDPQTAKRIRDSENLDFYAHEAEDGGLLIIQVARKARNVGYTTDNVGLTAPQRNDLMGQAEALHAVMPHPSGTMTILVATGPFVYEGFGPSTYGFAVEGKPHITMRPEAVKRGVRPDALMPSAREHPREYVLAHEWAHTVDQRNLEQRTADNDAFAGWIEGPGGARRRAMSQYAEGADFRSQPYERYAEAFAEHYLTGGRTDNAASRYFAVKYKWPLTQPGGSHVQRPTVVVAKAARFPYQIQPGDVLHGDTFTEEGPSVREVPAAAVVKFAPGLRPVLKHGDPSRPGYAALHPNSDATRLRPQQDLNMTVRGKPRTFTTDDPSDPANLSPESQAKLKTAMEDVYGITDDEIDANLDALYARAEASGALTVGREWYRDGGDIASERAVAVGLTREHGTAVFAAMSPQREWESNVAVGDYVMQMAVRNPAIPDLDRPMTRVVRIEGETKGTRVTKPAREWLDEEFERKGLGRTADVVGKPLDSLTPAQQGVLVRVMSQAGYWTGPNGEHGGPLSFDSPNRQGVMRTSKVSWGAGDNPTIKALAIARAKPGPELQAEIDSRLSGMKVRSFYNNLNFGTSNPRGDVTMDTHAMSAALGRVVPAKSKEGDAMFGGPPRSDPEGWAGTYPVFAAAYRRVAAKHGLPPHELQAALWVQWRHETDGMPIITHSSRM